MKHLFRALAIATVALTMSCNNNEIPAPEALKNIVPDAATITETSGLSEIHNASGDIIGYMALSKPASDSIQGYAGETPLMVVMDNDRKIKATVLMENNETPAFVDRVAEGGLFDSWNGMTITEAAAHTPDAISGATFTSNGVIQSMQACMKALDK